MSLKIEIGSTKELRHIGVQPPLSLRQMGILNLFGCQRGHPVGRFVDEVPETGRPYSDAIIDIEDGCDKETADKITLDTAQEIATALRDSGITVLVDENLHNLERDIYLFNEQNLVVDRAD